MSLKKPSFWDLPKPSLVSYLLIPFTLPIVLRNFLFQFLKKEKSSNIKTICVGNIYLGGTGKTPLTIKISQILNKQGVKVATVKKNYLNQTINILDKLFNSKKSQKNIKDKINKIGQKILKKNIDEINLILKKI